MKKVTFGLKTRIKLHKLNIRIPSEIKLLKKVRLSENLKIENNSTFYKGRFLWSMGAFSYSASELDRESIVGRYCSIGRNVSIMGYQHPLNRFTTSTITYSNEEFSTKNNLIVHNEINKKPLTIMNDVWIGDNVVLKEGITVGNGSVIACNAVVTKDVPPYSIVGGIPAKVIRYRFEENIINALLESAWWECNILDLDFKYDCNIEQFILEIKRGNLKTMLFDGFTIK